MALSGTDGFAASRMTSHAPVTIRLIPKLRFIVVIILFRTSFHKSLKAYP